MKKGRNYFLVASSGALCVLLLTYVFWMTLNYVYPLPRINQDYSVNVLSSEGETLRQFADETGTFRIPVKQSEVAPVYINTLLAYEDQNFYHHNGFELSALGRAFWQRIYYRKIISGGSTISMQVARLLYPIERSYWGKIKQIFRALQLEERYSKKEILELYFAYAPMGGNIDGVEAASQRYFGKSAKNLNLSEAALLTVIPQRPSIYRPDRFPELAYSARNKVLRRLVQQGSLERQEYDLLSKEKVASRRLPVRREVPLMARDLKQEFQNEQTIKTTIELPLQHAIDSLIKQRFVSLSDDLSVALMVLDNQSGNVLAYKGSLDMDSRRSFGHVDMTRAVRSPGSTLKPFIYGLALEEGLIHSESLMLDIPTEFGDYKPQNFNQRFQGAISVSEALQRSKNITPVYLLDKIGVAKFLDRMEILGGSLRLADNNLTVALGGGGSTLRELIMFYSALNRSGEVIKPRFTDQDVLKTHQLLSAESAWIVKTILEDIRPPDRARAKYGRKIAWKTGTSYGFRDAWAIGTSADYTVGVWVGRPDGTPYVGQTGAGMAAPLLFDVFDLLPKDKRSVLKPERVVRAEICWPSGLRHNLVSASNCKVKLDAWTIDGVTPRTLRRNTTPGFADKWPQELLSWKKQFSKNSKYIDIISPENGSYIYPYAGQKMELKASSPDVQWYLDGKVSSDVVSVDTLHGSHSIKACSVDACREVNITVY